MAEKNKGQKLENSKGLDFNLNTEFYTYSEVNHDNDKGYSSTVIGLIMP